MEDLTQQNSENENSMLNRRRERGETRADQRNTEIDTETGKKKFRLNARNLFLTYPKCAETKEELLKHLLDSKYLNPHFILIAQETHQDGGKHLHAYVQQLTPCDIRSPKALDFKGCHGNYASAKGNYYEVKDYLEKEDEAPLVWGEPNTARNKSEETKFGIAQRNKRLATEKLTDLVDKGDIKIESYLQIKKSVLAYQMDRAEVGGWMAGRRCIWIQGPPGCCKSKWVRDHFQGRFYTKPQNKWWDGYKQEPVVCIEDFDDMGKCLGHYLKIWADGYSFYGEYKGGTVPCNYHLLIITSNYWPEDIWRNGPNEPNNPILLEAISRRFKFYKRHELDAPGVTEGIMADVDTSIAISK